MFGNRGNSGMLNRDFVERFERMYWTKTFSIFLEDAKPFGSVGGVGALVDACIDFAFDNSADFFVDAWRYWNILFDPRCMRHNWNFNGRKEISAEFSSFRVFPCETFVLFAHKVMHKKALLFRKKVT